MSAGYWSRRSAAYLSRRTFLRRGTAAALGTGSIVLFGCSSNKNNRAAVPAATATITGGAATAGPAAASAATAGVRVSPAPQGNSVPVPKRGGTLNVAYNRDPYGLDPHLSTGGQDRVFLYTMFDNLISYNQTGDLDPSISLAAAWETPDPQTITVTLRPNISFHDGTPFNAAAVKFNFDRVMDPATASPATPQVAAVQRVDVLSDSQVKLTLNSPNAALMYALGDKPGMMLSPAGVQKYGKDFARNPIGTGPFIFKQWNQSANVAVVKNPKYWGTDKLAAALPYLDGITWSIIPDDTVSIANLQAGTAHICGLPAADYDRFKADSGYTVSTFSGSGTHGAIINNAVAPFDDLHFRRAFARATDKAAMVKALTFGQSPVGIGYITPSCWAFNKNLQGLDFDLSEAKKELAASKYPNGTSFDALDITIPLYKQQAELQQQMLKAVNINMSLTTVDAADASSRMYNGGKGGGTVTCIPASFGSSVDPDSVATSLFLSNSFFNAGHQPNDQLDSLIVQARQTLDRAARQKLYDQIQTIKINDVSTYTFEWYDVVHEAARRNVQNMGTFWNTDGGPRYVSLWLS